MELKVKGGLYFDTSMKCDCYVIVTEKGVIQLIPLSSKFAKMEMTMVIFKNNIAHGILKLKKEYSQTRLCEMVNLLNQTKIVKS